MGYWFGFSLINLFISLRDIYKQGYCKGFDLAAALIMFLAGPFGTGMVLLHMHAEKINNVSEIIIWKKNKSYNDILKDYQRRK